MSSPVLGTRRGDEAYRRGREIVVCGTDGGSWAVFLESRSSGKRSGAQLVSSAQSHLDCWRHCGF